MDIKEGFSSNKLLVNVKQVKKTESDECNTSTNCNPKEKISLIGIRRTKNGRYAAVITDRIRHKKVWLGTFDTVEEASQAYFSKKSEFENEKLRLQGKKKSKKIRKLKLLYNSEKSEKLVNVKQGNENVNCEISQTESTGGSEIDVLISNSSNRGSEQRIDSRETGEAFRIAKEGSRVFNSGLMANVCGTKSSDECNTTTRCDPIVKISLIGVRRQKSGRYAAVITDPIKHKKVSLGTFDTVEEASHAYLAKKSEFENEKLRQQGNKKSKRICETTGIVLVHKRGKYNSEKSEELVSVKQGNENADCEIFQTESAGGSEIDVPISNSSNGGTEQMIDISNSSNGGTEQRIDSQEIGTVEEACRIAKEGSRVFNSGLMANVRGTKSFDECNTTTRCDPNVKISLIGVRRRKSGRYAAVITDPIKHKEVRLGTFDTVEEASHAYMAKKSEFEKLRQQGNKENKPKKNCDQIQQPESSSVVASLDTTASESGRAKRIDSQGEEPGSSKATSCLMANAHSAESTSCDPKARRSLKGIRRRKSGRYAVVITDPIKHKEVGLGTFDTVEEASNAYLAKKSEFEKLIQGNKENKPKKNCDQIQQPESSSVVASLDTTASESGSSKRIDSHKTTTHLIGAYKSKTTGRYTSEFKNPITKKKIWLGTFDTAEEASHAFQSKKLEFQKLVKAKQQQCTNKQRKSEKLDNVKQGHENVNCELKSAEIDVLLSNSSIGGTVQSIDSYQSKKSDLQISKEVELQSNMPTDSSAGEKQEGQEDDEDLWMGKWVQLPGDDKAVMFSLKLGLPIIDNYGYLIGEFSSLDDLSIS